MRREQDSKLKGRTSLLATEVAGLARRSQAPRISCSAPTISSMGRPCCQPYSPVQGCEGTA